MSGGTPVPSGPTKAVSKQDAEALDKLQAYRIGLLADVRARAEKWIAGLVAVTGVITTAVVIKGPESFTKLGAASQQSVIALIVTGAVFLGVGVFLAYCAAFGNPFGKDKLLEAAQKQSPSTAWNDWSTISERLATLARGFLQWAAIATILGTAFLGAAILVTWLTPPPAASDSSSCVQIDGTSATVIDCP